MGRENLVVRTEDMSTVFRGIFVGSLVAALLLPLAQWAAYTWGFGWLISGIHTLVALFSGITASMCTRLRRCHAASPYDRKFYTGKLGWVGAYIFAAGFSLIISGLVHMFDMVRRGAQDKELLGLYGLGVVEIGLVVVLAGAVLHAKDRIRAMRCVCDAVTEEAEQPTS